jgi:hypothetical protein
MVKKIRFLVGFTGLVAAMSLSLLPRATAQITDEEFQMGRAREACTIQAQQQLLTVNGPITSTTPIFNNSGQMIGSDVIVNVTRHGETYDVRCSYDNATRVATIVNVSSQAQNSGNSTRPVAQTNFEGRGVAQGAAFTRGRNANVFLTIDSDNFVLELVEPRGSARVQYRGAVIRRQSDRSENSSSFTLDGRVRTTTSSDNLRSLNNTTGTCRVKVFDSRVNSINCNTVTSDSSARFLGLEQF